MSLMLPRNNAPSVCVVRGCMDYILAKLLPYSDAHMLQVTLAEDVEAIANKLIILKTFYPSADIYKIVSHRPKILLQSHNNIAQNAKQVRKHMNTALRRSLVYGYAAGPYLSRHTCDS